MYLMVELLFLYNCCELTAAACVHLPIDSDPPVKCAEGDGKRNLLHPCYPRRQTVCVCGGGRDPRGVQMTSGDSSRNLGLRRPNRGGRPEADLSGPTEPAAAEMTTVGPDIWTDRGSTVPVHELAVARLSQMRLGSVEARGCRNVEVRKSESLFE